MGFADPQSVTINAVAQSLPRTSQGVNEGQFTKDDGNVTLKVRHSYGRRNRRNVWLQQRKIASDPLNASVNVMATCAVSMTVDSPPFGFTNAEIKYLVDALTAYLTASSGAKVTQLLGGES